MEKENNIQWYPGHMFKAKKEIIEKLKIIDFVVEIIDARVPRSSHNLMLDSITENKAKLIVFSKIDYINVKSIEKFEKDYHNNGYNTIKVNLKKSQERQKVLNYIDQLTIPIKEKFAKKGINKTIRILIVGMPNVGKSTFINFLVNKKKTAIADRPGVTKQQIWIKLSRDIELLDTPGVLVPKIQDKIYGYNLVLCSIIKEQIVNREEVAIYLLEFLFERNFWVVKKRYNLDYNNAEFDVEDLYNKIGKNIGALLKKGEIDYDRVTNTILNDYRDKKLGNLVLDE